MVIIALDYAYWQNIHVSRLQSWGVTKYEYFDHDFFFFKYLSFNYFLSLWTTEHQVFKQARSPTINQLQRVATGGLLFINSCNDSGFGAARICGVCLKITATKSLVIAQPLTGSVVTVTVWEHDGWTDGLECSNTQPPKRECVIDANLFLHPGTHPNIKIVYGNYITYSFLFPTITGTVRRRSNRNTKRKTCRILSLAPNTTLTRVANLIPPLTPKENLTWY